MSTELVTTTMAADAETIALPDEIRAAIAAEKSKAPKGTVKLVASQRAALMIRATEADVQIKPTGEVYMPGVFYRTVLQTVFGPGAWHVDAGTPYMDIKDDSFRSTLYLQVRLVVGRCVRCQRSVIACECGQPSEEICIAEDIGAAAYHPTNGRLAKDDAIVSAITNGLMRCCSKTLGVYANCWEPQWADDARWAVGIKVRVADWQNKVKPQWRRWDRRPLDGEQGIFPDSPNADKYQAKAKVEPKAKPGDDFKQALVDVLPRETKPVATTAKPVAPTTVKPVSTKPVGEQVGVIRKDASGPTPAWIVTTDVATHWTDDSHVVTDLERLKARGKRVVFVDEILPGARGERKKILDYTAADK